MESSKIESGIQLFSRLKPRISLENLNPILFRDGGPFQEQVIEIAGKLGTGKTSLITDLLVRCLLPKEYKGINLVGRNCGAILINTDHHFELFKLINLMEHSLKECDANLSASDITGIISDSLKNLLLLNCYDSEQLDNTFKSLDKLLLENNHICLIALDSISSYYWSNKNNFESFNFYCNKILKMLLNVVKAHKTVIIYTKAESEQKPAESWTSYKVFLEKVNDNFQALVTDVKQNHQYKVCYSLNCYLQFLK